MRRFVGFWPVLFAIALVGLILRLLGLNWDHGYGLHPDERFISMVTNDTRWPSSVSTYFDTATSPLNPYNSGYDTYVYGTFPMFLTKAIATWLDMDVYGKYQLVGRALSAGADAGSILITGWLARRFFNRRAGLLAALLLAFTPLFLQSAHYYTVDSISVLFVVASFAALVRGTDRRSLPWFLVAGVAIGLAGASKPNLLMVAGFLLLPVLESVRTGGWKQIIPNPARRDSLASSCVIASVLMAIWVFRIAQPYAFQGPNVWNLHLNQQWLNDLSFWRAAQTGLVDIKSSIQWVDRTPIAFILEQMVRWGMGPALGIAALAGLALGSWRLLTARVWPSWWWIGIIAWCVMHIVMYGSGIAQNQRYLMTAYPFLIIIAAGVLVEAAGRWQRSWIPRVAIAVVVGYTVFYGAAFDTLFVRPITRIEASEWIYENVPAGSVLTAEYWDDSLPMPLPGFDRSEYTYLTLDLYAGEEPATMKLPTLVSQLSQADYIILSSNRIIDSVPRQDTRYPMATRYYEMLESGDLGFEEIARFEQSPELLGIRWDDSAAEESMTVYEHPMVRIYRKTDAFDANRVYAELQGALGPGGYTWLPGDPLPRQMFLTDGAASTNHDYGTWRNVFPLANAPFIVQAAGWYLSLAALGALTWPVARRIAGPSPDLGWGMARLGGPVLLATILTLANLWLHIPVGRTMTVITLVLWLLAAIAATRRGRRAIASDLRAHRREILATELIALLWFALALGIRHVGTPAFADVNSLWTSLLAAVTRSSTLPPYDPWLSGGALHTQWWGLMPTAVIARLWGVPPGVGVDLAIATILSLTAVGVVTLARRVLRPPLSWLAPFFALACVPAVMDAVGAGALNPALTVLPLILLALVTGLQPRARGTGGIVQVIVFSIAIGAVAVSIGPGLILAGILVALCVAWQVWPGHLVARWWPLIRQGVWMVILTGLIAGLCFGRIFAMVTPTARNRVPGTILTLPGLWHLAGAGLALLAVLGVGVVAMAARESWRDGRAGRLVGGLTLAIAGLVSLSAIVVDNGLMLGVLLVLFLITATVTMHDRPARLSLIGIAAAGVCLLLYSQIAPQPANLLGLSSGEDLRPTLALLIGIAAAIGTLAVMDRIAPRGQSLVLAAMIGLFSLSFVFPVGSPTIGTGDASVTAATTWLDQNTTGLPVILAGPDTSAQLALQGYPTVLAQPGPEQYLRPGWGDLIERRTADVQAIMGNVAPYDYVASTIGQYDVRYIVIGPADIAQFGDGIQKFEDAANTGRLNRVYQADGVTVYEVPGR